jgi:hypothetical protein
VRLTFLGKLQYPDKTQTPPSLPTRKCGQPYGARQMCTQGPVILFLRLGFRTSNDKPEYHLTKIGLTKEVQPHVNSV